VRDNTAVFAIVQPQKKVTLRNTANVFQGHRVGTPKSVQHVVKVRVLRRSMCIDNGAEGGGLRRRSLRIETADVELFQEGRDMAKALRGIANRARSTRRTLYLAHPCAGIPQ
jgi:hypothetical protein